METAATNFEERLKLHASEFARVVPFEPGDKLLRMDFTEKNTELTDELLMNTDLFIQYINAKLKEADAKYGIGGYGENRTVYRRSKVFDAPKDLTPNPSPGERGSANTQPSPVRESRSLHLGTDIWGKPYTKVMAPLNGIVHSFAFNNAFGDYGATIILTHNLDGESFHTLYGHLSLNSIKNIQEGDVIKKGDVFAEAGIPFENGQWPPHLHFQIIKDLQGMKGDYPGVCAFSEREKYLANCPDADLILQIMQYVK